MNAKQTQQIKKKIQGGPVRRLIVVLDVTTESERALASAAELAGGLKAGLVVLFADGQGLSELEGHPMVRTIELPTGRGGGLGPGSMKRGVKAMARRTRRRVGRLSRRYRIDARFEVVGGDLRKVLKGQAGTQDLLVVESSGRKVMGGYRLPSSGRQLTRGIDASMLYVDKTQRPVRSVALLYDGSKAAKRGLLTALGLGGGKRAPMITVLWVGASKEEVEDHKEEVRAIVEKRRRPVRIHGRRITCCAYSEILEVAQGMRSDLLIVPRGASYEAEGALDQLIEECPCPVLVFS